MGGVQSCSCVLKDKVKLKFADDRAGHVWLSKAVLAHREREE